MSMRLYVEHLKKFAEDADRMAKEIQTCSFQLNQAKNDHESLLLQNSNLKKECEDMQTELRSRNITVEAAMSKMREELQKKIAEAEVSRKQASNELDKARKERAAAEELRQDAERVKRDYSEAMAGSGSKRR